MVLRLFCLLFLSLPAFAGTSRQLSSPEQVPEGLGKSDWQSIRAAHEGWKHQIQAVDGGWQAHNPGQQWSTRFDGRGFVATPKDAEWTWGLEFQSYGFGDRQTRVSGRPEVRTDGQRLSYRWSDTVEEWFINDGRGLEHGFTLAERPAGSRENEALALTLATRGPLMPSLSADRQTVHFRDKATAPVLNYSGLKVWDADGTVLPSRFQVVGRELRLLVEETSARYPLTIDPIAQQAYLKAGNNGGPTSDAFGKSVAVSGDTVVVGAPGEDSGTTGVNSTPNNSATDSGAAYVFTRSGSTWTQQAYLKASNTGAADNFGISLAVSGDTVVVGAHWEDSGTTGVNSTPNESASSSGAAYVYVRSGATWSQQAYLKASNTGASDNFGYSVSVSGDTVVVGAHLEDSSTTGVNSTPNESAITSGAAYVFVRSGTTWSQQAYLKASNTGSSDWFGWSVAVSGDTVVVGAIQEGSSTTGVNSTPNESGGNSGAAYVFVRSGTIWSQQAYLKASNTQIADQFGYSVAVSGDTVVVGAHWEDSGTTGVNSTPNESGNQSGAAYVFVRSGTTWSQQAYLKASNTEAFDEFGTSVSVSGDTVVVGAYLEDSSTTGVNSTSNESASSSGAAYVYVRSGATWSQQGYLKASNTGGGDAFGLSVAVSGDTVVAGAWGEDSSTTGVNGIPDEISSGSGAAYVFTRNGTTWSQQAYLKASNTPPSGSGASDFFAYSVSVSGDTVVLGAVQEDSSTTGVNSTPDELATDAGAAYVFVRSGTTWTQQAYLKASNTQVGDQFGRSVAVSGDAVVVGAWQEDSGTTGINSLPNESAAQSGAAYVFIRSGTTWSQQAYLKASNTGGSDFFGRSVAVAGDTVVVGADGEDSSTTGVNSTPNESAASSGAAYVFIRSGTSWSQQAYLKASNTGGSDVFGSSVAIADDTVVVGAWGEDSSTTGVNSTPNESASGSGAAYVFTRSGTTWSQPLYLKASNTGGLDSFGRSVAVSSDTIIVGAPGEDSGTTGANSIPNESAADSGAAYVFTRSGLAWSQQAYLKASNTGASDQIGYSVAVSGDTVVVGASFEDSGTTGVNSTPNESAVNSGAAYVFIRIGTTWSEQAYLKASNAGASDQFGTSVSVSGDTVIVGATGEASSTSGVNSTSDEGANESGAAYIFTGLGPLPDISSGTTASGVVGTTFSDYTITASNSPTSYSASGLPSGLSINTANGVISGTPTQAGTFSVTLGATNASGTGNATLTLVVYTPAILTSLQSGTALDLPASAYGTASSPVQCVVTGDRLTAGITATAPAGMEVSSDGTTYAATAVFPATGGTLYVRFSAAVAAGSYSSQNVALSSPGATSVDVAVSGSVSPKALIITAPMVAKVYDGTTTAGVVTVGDISGLIGSETLAVTATATPYGSANVGSSYASIVSYTLADGVNGGMATNYAMANSAIVNASITKKALTVTAGDVTKLAGATLNAVTGSTVFTSSGLVVPQTIGSVTLTYGSGAAGSAAAGNYAGQVVPSAVTGGTFAAGNYQITYLAGNLTVLATSQTASYSTGGEVPITSDGYTATGRTISFSLNYAPAVGTELMVVKNTGLNFIVGTFENLAQGQTVKLTFGGNTYTFVANYFGGSGNDLVLAWANIRMMTWGENASAQLGDGAVLNRSVPGRMAGTLVSALNGKTVTTVAAGGNHSVALCSDGTVAAWGANYYNQLGNSTRNSPIPVAVNRGTGSALNGKTVTTVAAGANHSVALCSDGTVAAWGANYYSQLGNGNTWQPSFPVAVNRGTGSALDGKTVIAVAAGGDHSMALCSDGTVAAWGNNGTGQLGNSSTSQSSIPVVVNRGASSALNGKTVIAVAAGANHSVALCSDGTVAAWGFNSHGQLGNSNTANSLIPVAVNRETGSALNGKTVIAVAAGSNHSVALCSDGTVAAWGNNGTGQLGNSNTANSLIPVAVNRGTSSALNGKTVIAVAAGGNHSVALCSDGTVAAWGYNGDSQLGNSNTANSLIPVTVNRGTGSALTSKTVIVVAAGSNHSVALCSDGTVAAWGANYSGQLGGGNTRQSPIPVAVNTESYSSALNGKTVITVAAGRPHSVALCSDGTVAAWGSNSNGELGNGNTTNSSIPVAVDRGTNSALNGKTVIAVAAGEYHSVALCSDGTVAAWGFNSNGQLGNSNTANSLIPVAVNRGASSALTGKTVSAVAAGDYHSVALCSDGTVAAWGYNGNGQLGNSNTTNSSIPVAVTRGSGALNGKTVVANSGALGNGNNGTIVNVPGYWNGSWYVYGYSYTTMNSSIPVAVTRGSGALNGKTVTAIAAGEYHSVALCSDGTVAAWGSNGSGQLGNNTFSNSSVPVAVSRATLGAADRFLLGARTQGKSHSLSVVALPAYTVTVLAHTNGFISPAGTTEVNSSQTYTITPNPGYHVADVLVDGVSVGPMTSYVFNDLSADRSISAIFAISQPPTDITLSATSVAEGQPAGTIVGTLNSPDVPAGTETFTLVSGTGSADNSSFSIAGNVLKTAAVFDYATKASCSIRVRVTEGFGATFEKIFTIGVIDSVVVGTGGEISVTSGEELGGAPLVIDGGTLSAGGSTTLAVTNPVSLSGSSTIEGSAVTLSGAVTLADNTSLNVSSSTVTVNGSLDAANAGGTFSKTGSGTLVLNGDISSVSAITIMEGTIVVNGSSGTTIYTVGNAATLQGNGSVGVIVLQPGSTISPGNSPGSMRAENSTWSGGSKYDWEINDANGIGGSNPGWDVIQITGALTITATPANQFNFKLLTLDLNNAPGEMVNFNNARSYAWTVVTTTGGITGFDPAAIHLNPSGFLNATPGGTFSLAVMGGTDLVVIFTSAKPETTITSGPLPVTNSPSAEIAFTGTDNAGVTGFEGSLDGAVFAPVTSPVNLTNLADGIHTFEVRAIDADGNVDATPASITWTVDSTPPMLSLPANITLVVTSPDGVVVNYSASASDPGGSGVVTSRFTPESGSIFLIGTTIVNASATDNAGNTVTGSFTVTVQINSAPTFAGYSISTPWQTAATISLAKLLAKAADANGDPLSVTAAGPTSAQGGTAVLQSGSILYTPPNGFSGADSFQVTLADPHGLTVVGTVTVSVGAAPDSGGQGSNSPQLRMLSGGKVEIAFQGIPDRSYQIQRSTHLSNWTDIATVVAAASGVVTYIDASPPPGNGFYRLRKP